MKKLLLFGVLCLSIVGCSDSKPETQHNSATDQSKINDKVVIEGFSYPDPKTASAGDVLRLILGERPLNKSEIDSIFLAYRIEFDTRFGKSQLRKYDNSDFKCIGQRNNINIDTSVALPLLVSYYKNTFIHAPLDEYCYLSPSYMTLSKCDSLINMHHNMCVCGLLATVILQEQIINGNLGLLSGICREYLNQQNYVKSMYIAIFGLHRGDPDLSALYIEIKKIYQSSESVSNTITKVNDRNQIKVMRSLLKGTSNMKADSILDNLVEQGNLRALYLKARSEEGSRNYKKALVLYRRAMTILHKRPCSDMSSLWFIIPGDISRVEYNINHPEKPLNF